MYLSFLSIPSISSMLSILPPLIMEAAPAKTLEEKLNDIISSLSGFVWDNILVYLLLGVGLYYTVMLGFPQVTRLKNAFKHAFGGIFKKNSGGISSFQALATAVAAQIGTGNIGGVATAIVSGGPGAIFWMWISGILGMSTIFAEAVLAQIFRTEKEGSIVGGPAYYLSKGLKNRKLGRIMAVCFSIFIIFALGLVGNMVQSNSIGLALKTAFGIAPLISGIMIAILAALIFIGGIQRIAKFASMAVPLMAIFYLIASIIILIMYGNQLLPVLNMIFTSAFSSKAIMGGLAGVAVKKAIRLGLARGLFSNEAGMGSTPHAHAVATVDHPSQQGFTAMGGVIVDTLIVCTATALIILVTGARTVDTKLTSVALTQKGFELAFGHMGNKFLGISLLFFAFTTIIGWYYFGESNIIYLFGSKALWPYRILVIAFIIAGSVFKVTVVWTLSDLANALMVIPNVIGLFILSPLVIKEKRAYEKLPLNEKFSDCT